jgi:hypothetical protein
MRPSLRLVPLAVLAALAFTAPGASADPLCVGTAEDAKVCVDPAGTPTVTPSGTLFSRCVFVPGDPDCKTVAVPGVQVDSGPVPLVTCTGPSCPPSGGGGDPTDDLPLPGGGCPDVDPSERGPVIPRVVFCIAYHL